MRLFFGLAILGLLAGCADYDAEGNLAPHLLRKSNTLEQQLRGFTIRPAVQDTGIRFMAEEAAIAGVTSFKGEPDDGGDALGWYSFGDRGIKLVERGNGVFLGVILHEIAHAHQHDGEFDIHEHYLNEGHTTQWAEEYRNLAQRAADTFPNDRLWTSFVPRLVAADIARH